MQHRFVILTLTLLLLLLLQASSYPKTANAASAVWKSWSSRKIRSNEDTSASSSSSSSSESDSSEGAAVLALNIVSDCQDIPKDFRLIIKRYFHIDKNIDDYSIYRYRAKLIKDSIADLYEKIENLSFNLSRYLSKTYDSGSHEERQPDDFVNTTLDGSLILGTMYDVGLQLIEALQQLHDRLVVDRKMFLANNAMTSTSTTAIVETKLLLPVSSEFKVSFVKERLMPSVNRLKSTCEFLIRNLLPPPLQNNSAEN